MGVYKFSDASSLASDKISYRGMLAGNTTWVDWIPLGGYDSLGSITVPSAVTTVTMTGIPQGYKNLQLRILARSDRASTETFLYCRINEDTGNNYSRHAFRGSGSAASTDNDVPFAGLALERIPAGSQPANYYGALIVDFPDYAHPQKNKTVNHIGGYSINGTGQVIVETNAWRSNEPIRSLTFTIGDGGNISANTKISMYGIR